MSATLAAPTIVMPATTAALIKRGAELRRILDYVPVSLRSDGRLRFHEDAR